MKEITREKLDQYFDVTTRARDKVKELNPKMDESTADMFDMIERYISDARHFAESGDFVNAFAALNYAHGWLDAGARLGKFYVAGDNVLFTVDEEE